MYFSARVRAGFVPATRRDLFKRIGHPQTDKCPFVNLPEKSAGRCGLGLTAEKMKECVWVSSQGGGAHRLSWSGPKAISYGAPSLSAAGATRTLAKLSENEVQFNHGGTLKWGISSVASSALECFLAAFAGWCRHLSPPSGAPAVRAICSPSNPSLFRTEPGFRPVTLTQYFLNPMNPHRVLWPKFRDNLPPLMQGAASTSR